MQRYGSGDYNRGYKRSRDDYYEDYGDYGFETRSALERKLADRVATLEDRLDAQAARLSAQERCYDELNSKLEVVFQELRQALKAEEDLRLEVQDLTGRFVQSLDASAEASSASGDSAGSYYSGDAYDAEGYDADEFE